MSMYSTGILREKLRLRFMVYEGFSLAGIWKLVRVDEGMDQSKQSCMKTFLRAAKQLAQRQRYANSSVKVALSKFRVLSSLEFVASCAWAVLQRRMCKHWRDDPAC